MKIRLTTLFLMLIALMPFNLSADHLSSTLQVTAQLNGANEVPEVSTDAQGLAIVTLDRALQSAQLMFQATKLSGPITGIHIHEAVEGQNGGVVLNLTPFLNGSQLNTKIESVDNFQLAKLLNGEYYLNVHTELNPGGEIRGQFKLESDQLFGGVLSGLQESPPVTTDASGYVSAVLSSSGQELTVRAIFENLPDTITGAHLHVAAPGMNGPVVVNLTAEIDDGMIEAKTDPSAFLDDLLKGQIYLNIHTAQNPGGEIRGQLNARMNLSFDATLDGGQEVPPVTTEGRGLAQFIWNPLTNEIVVEGFINSGVDTITGAHLHVGAPGSTGGVVVNLSNTIVGSGLFSDTITDPSTDLYEAMLSGGIYLNVHTVASPSGEIRGHVYRTAREGYLTMMNGGQEVPPVSTSATGVAMISIDRDQTNAHYMTVFSGLEGTFAASHFHQGSPGQNGGVLFNLGSSVVDSSAAYGYWTNLGDAALAIRNGEVYINVHSSASPSGEIRGNMKRGSQFVNRQEVNPKFSGQLLYTGRLSGANEVPEITTDAAGVVGVLVDTSRSKAQVMLSVTDLSSAFRGVHLHLGAQGENGPVAVSLTDVYDRGRISAEVDMTMELLTAMNEGLVYINVHTENHPGGEIRAQVRLEQEMTFTTKLSGEQVVPANTSRGQGLATFHLTPGLNTMSVNVKAVNLSSPIAAAHLHMGLPGQNGGVVLNLSDLIEGNEIRGIVDATDVLTMLMEGTLYLNVHTDSFPSGEIRGQLAYQSGLSFDGWLSGGHSVPINISSGSGLVSMHLDPTFDTLSVDVLVDHLAAPISAAHLHVAPQGENGGVWLNLGDGIDSLSISGQFTELTPAQLSNLLSGNVYLNVHTAAFPSGEVRAQMYGLIRDGYQFDLCPQQETSPLGLAQFATGGGILSLDRNGSNLHLMSTTSGLTGEITGAHIHEAPIGENSGVILNLTDLLQKGSIFTYQSVENSNADLVSVIQNGNAYLNIHTERAPAGEIRGQIVRESLCPARNTLPEVNYSDPSFNGRLLFSARLSGDQEVPVVSTAGIGIATLQLSDDLSMATINVSVSNLTSTITGMHIHHAPVGENGPVIVSLTDALQGNRATISFAVDEEFIEFLMSNELYLNVHTDDVPSGEIRGQMMLEAPETYAVALESDEDTGAFGFAAVHYTESTNSLEVNVLMTGLSGPITGIHLHEAPEDDNGPVVESLTEYLTGNAVRVTLDAGDYIESLRNEGIYINVHTEAFPSGEARGQLFGQPGVWFDTWLTGAQEVPAAENLTVGYAIMLIEPDLESMYYAVLVDQPTDTLNAAHIHAGPLGENGGVVVPLMNESEYPNAFLNDDPVILTRELRNAMLSGQYYVNVHTSNFPAGEVRGQIYRLARQGYAFDLCPEQEVMVVDAPDATGAGLFTYNRSMDEAQLMTVVSGLTSTVSGSHIHTGAEGENGGVIFNFTDQFSNNSAFVTWTGANETAFDSSFAYLVNDGNAYVNIHTETHPTGELRGQIVPDPSCAFTTSIFSPDVRLGINIRPNPVVDQLQVEVPEGLENVFLEIIDMKGNVHLQRDVLGSSVTRLTTDRLHPGMYLLRLSSGRDVYVQKFLKM